MYTIDFSLLLQVKTQMLRELQEEVSEKASALKNLQDAVSQRDAYIAQVIPAQPTDSKILV